VDSLNTLDPIAGDRYLGIGFGAVKPDGTVALYSGRFTTNGEALEGRIKLARINSSASALKVVQGVGGRIAVKWDSLDVNDTKSTHVQVFDARGVAEGSAAVIHDPPGPLDSVLALPLEQGFAMVRATDTSVFVQAYSPVGTPVGDPQIIAPSPQAGSFVSVAFVENRQAYFLSGLLSQPSPNSTLAALWQVGLEPPCGDANGDQSVTGLDALRILRATTGAQSCDPCSCDIDGSGTVDAADAVLALRLSLGQSVATACPRCEVGN
jgi:hypothetical protein